MRLTLTALETRPDVDDVLTLATEVLLSDDYNEVDDLALDPRARPPQAANSSSNSEGTASGSSDHVASAAQRNGRAIRAPRAQRQAQGTSGGSGSSVAAHALALECIERICAVSPAPAATRAHPVRHRRPRRREQEQEQELDGDTTGANRERHARAHEIEVKAADAGAGAEIGEREASSKSARARADAARALWRLLPGAPPTAHSSSNSNYNYNYGLPTRKALRSLLAYESAAVAPQDANDDADEEDNDEDDDDDDDDDERQAGALEATLALCTATACSASSAPAMATRPSDDDHDHDDDVVVQEEAEATTSASSKALSARRTAQAPPPLLLCDKRALVALTECVAPLVARERHRRLGRVKASAGADKKQGQELQSAALDRLASLAGINPPNTTATTASACAWTTRAASAAGVVMLVRELVRQIASQHELASVLAGFLLVILDGASVSTTGTSDGTESESLEGALEEAWRVASAEQLVVSPSLDAPEERGERAASSSEQRQAHRLRVETLHNSLLVPLLKRAKATPGSLGCSETLGALLARVERSCERARLDDWRARERQTLAWLTVLRAGVGANALLLVDDDDDDDDNAEREDLMQSHQLRLSLARSRLATEEVLHHASPAIRQAALSVFVLAPLTSSAHASEDTQAAAAGSISVRVLDAIHKLAECSVGDEDGTLRMALPQLMTRLFLRLRESSSRAARRRSRARDAEEGAQDEQELEHVRSFVGELAGLATRDLTPGKPYRCQSNALALLEVILHSGVDRSFDARADPKAQVAWPFDLRVADERTAGVLLSLMLSTFRALRSGAQSLLERFSKPLPGYDGDEGAEKARRELVAPAVALVCSSRESDASSGAEILALVMRLFGPSPPPALALAPHFAQQPTATPTFEYTSALLVELSKRLDAYDADLAAAARATPLHGLLLALRHVLEAARGRGDATTTQWREILAQVLHAADRVWDATRPVLAAAPGVGETADNEEARAWRIYGDGAGEDDGADDEGEELPGHKLVLASCWRAMKETGHLVTAAFETPFVASNTTMWSEAEAERTGKRLLDWITLIKHRGGYMAMFAPLARVAALALSRRELASLPARWLMSLVNVIAQVRMSTTRRSAGVPYGVLALAQVLIRTHASEVDAALECLLATAESDHVPDESRVHALNVLRTIVLDGKLAGYMGRFNERCFRLAISLFWSPKCVLPPLRAAWSALTRSAAGHVATWRCSCSQPASSARSAQSLSTWTGTRAHCRHACHSASSLAATRRCTLACSKSLSAPCPTTSTTCRPSTCEALSLPS